MSPVDTIHVLLGDVSGLWPLALVLVIARAMFARSDEATRRAVRMLRAANPLHPLGQRHRTGKRRAQGSG